MKWITIAREWLEENCPCSKLDAIQAIAARMPLGIRNRGRVFSQTGLACDAMRRIYGAPLSQLPQHLEKPMCVRKRTGVTSEICNLAKRGEGVAQHEIRHLKNGLKIARQLVKSGLLEKVGEVYFMRHES